MICGISNEEIIKEIDKHIIFETVCKIKNIDYESIIGDLINRIKDSNIEDMMDMIDERETWDSEYIHIIKEENVLFVHEDLLLNKREAIKFFEVEESELKYLWIQTTDEEKKVIKIAIECGLGEIRVEMM